MLGHSGIGERCLIENYISGNRTLMVLKIKHLSPFCEEDNVEKYIYDPWTKFIRSSGCVASIA